MLSASILGHGLIHSLGTGEEFFSQYKSGVKSDFASLANMTSVTTGIAGVGSEICSADVSGLAAMLPGVSLRRVPKYARMGLIAAVEALKSADLQVSDIEPDMGLVIGTAFSGAQMNIDFMDSILEASPHLSSPTAFSHAVNNMGAGLLSLFLNIRGGCQTVTQFDLSFAGALQTALLLLHSNKNEYVLLGAIDENDPRFIETCPEHLHNTPYPYTEGAVFFLLGKNVPNTPQISVSWGDTVSSASNPSNTKNPSSANKLMYCGDFTEDKQVNNASFYGTSPLAHALDTALAVSCETENTVCLCKQKDIQQMAAISIRK